MGVKIEAGDRRVGIENLAVAGGGEVGLQTGPGGGAGEGGQTLGLPAGLVFRATDDDEVDALIAEPGEGDLVQARQTRGEDQAVARGTGTAVSGRQRG